MAANPLVQLNRAGQSVWLDFVSRELLKTGGLRRLIGDDGVSGVTSNPTIFQKAISGSADYDPSLLSALGRGVKDPKELFIALAVEDIAEAADQLRPVYDAAEGADGFVSLEVSPDLAYDTRATIEEARRLFSEVGRPNVMIKVPATKDGLPAITTLISEGVNVNVTLLFSVERYSSVADAYIRGLELRAAGGGRVDRIASVASFFVSRVDTLVDKLLRDKGAGAALCGKAAVANAQLAYIKYEDLFGGPRFASLRAKGARPQRVLWASTGTKDPAYSDIKYVEELVAPNTVNTLPTATLEAFRDHGKPRVTIRDGMEGAGGVFEALKQKGIDIVEVTDRLEREGVKSFADSFFALLKDIGDKTAKLR